MKLGNNSQEQLKDLRFHPLPKDKIIFLDTSFVIDALFCPNVEKMKVLESKKQELKDEEKRELSKLKFLQHRHNVAVVFLEKLVKENINIAFSTILFQEVYFTSKYIVLEKLYDNDRKKVEVALKENPKILKDHIPDIMKNWNLFMDLLSKFKGRIFSITPSEPSIIEETLRIRVEHGLKPNDSFHLATIIVGKQRDIVVFDRKFKDVAIKEGLNVWYRV